MKPSIYTLLSCLVFLGGCSAPQEVDPYLVEIEQWRKDRLENLTRSDGWATLIGLYWLEDRVQSCGSAADNDIVFPDKAPAHIGQMMLINGKVNALVTPNLPVLLDGKPVSGRIVLNADIDENTNYFTYESLRWHIIKRGGKFGIRLKDTLNPARFDLTELPHYPVDKEWIVDAVFKPAGNQDTVQVLNEVGMDLALHPEGILLFEIKDQSYSFVALDGGPDALFVVMGDATTGETTYGGGRFLDIPRADSTGKTMIDFNRAYNPPCVYSEYATCPLPLPENVLPIEVTAGELLGK